jgi:hypothetical protein
MAAADQIPHAALFEVLTMGDVVNLNCITSLPIPVERVLSSAIEARLANVLVVGEREDGEFYFASSSPDGHENLWLLEVGKHRLIRIVEDE